MEEVLVGNGRLGKRSCRDILGGEEVVINIDTMAPSNAVEASKLGRRAITSTIRMWLKERFWNTTWHNEEC